jgi:DNA repair exonuclease SbcCD ATPase subunit
MTTDVLTSAGSAETTQADAFAEALGRQRAEIEAFLGAQRERLAGAEARLTDRLQDVALELAETQSTIRRTQEEQASRAEQLSREAADLVQLKKAFEASQAEWRARQQQAAEQQHELAGQIQAGQEALVRRFDELTAREAQIAETEARLRRDQEQLSLAQAQTRQHDLELVQSREALDARLRELETQREAWVSQTTQIEQTTGARLRELESRLSEATRHEDLLEDELIVARRTCTELKGKMADQATGPRGDDESCKSLQSERDSLAQRLDEAQERLAELQRQLDDVQTGVSLDKDTKENQSRHETAMEDLGRLKAQNERLVRQLAEARGGAAPSLSPDAADWESQKRRMLAALDDFDEKDEEDAAHRIEIEAVIRTTNAAVAAKDQEISELRQLVEQQRGQSGAAAAASLASEKLLDQDSVIQQEREKLRHLQDELQAKLRQAEIEISIERADMARQRMEIEEIMRQFAEDSAAAAGLRSGEPAPDKLPGRRWLARLGLKKQDEEEQ